MITGNAMLNCPVSAVTSSVAREATDSDNQRLRRGDADSSCDKVMEGRFKVQRSNLMRSCASAFFILVGVGIMVAHNPLHRSGRAGLLHPALASGNDAKAYPRIRMTDASMRKP